MGFHFPFLPRDYILPNNLSNPYLNALEAFCYFALDKQISHPVWDHSPVPGRKQVITIQRPLKENVKIIKI